MNNYTPEGDCIITSPTLFDIYFNEGRLEFFCYDPSFQLNENQTKELYEVLKEYYA